MKVEYTQYGFKWGFIEVERSASNDGTNKKKKANILTLKHPNGEKIEILATKEGFEWI